MRIADDFGLGRLHNSVILSLLKAGHLDGTSVMVHGSLANDDIEQLVALRKRGVQIGIHLNLTQPFAESNAVWTFFSLVQPFMNTRQCDAIEKELENQVQRFVHLFGHLPDYYDGHQHCHCFPTIAPLIEHLPFTDQIWVRMPLPSDWSGRWLNIRAGGGKVLVILALSVWARTIFRRAGLKMNDDFTGFLQLSNPTAVRRWLPRLLAKAGSNCLIMVHPGDANDDMQCTGHDPLSRIYEAEILAEERTID